MRAPGWRLAAVVVAVTALATACGTAASPAMLNDRGPEASRIAGAWYLMFGLASAVYVVVASLVVVAIVRRRAAAPVPRRLGDDAFIWIGGLAVPIVILGILAVVTVTTTNGVRQPRADALRIEVTGKRWWWDVRYPGAGVRTANEIHIPVGRQVALELRSDNVIHSFWVPQLAGKLDMVPGQTNVLRLAANRAGTYRGVCAEYCGIQHGRMDFLVIADPPAAFERWLARRQATTSGPTSELAAEGEQVFVRESCSGCHRIAGTPAAGTRGPDLSDFGSRRWIGSITVPNTPGYLAGWISNSQTIKPGNLMPPISLEPRELDALVAYLEGLK